MAAAASTTGPALVGSLLPTVTARLEGPTSEAECETDRGLLTAALVHAFDLLGEVAIGISNGGASGTVVSASGPDLAA